MRTAVGIAMAGLMAVAASHAFSPRPTPALASTAIPVARMQLNALVRSSAGLVAAGELGTLLFSSDDGRSWQRAQLASPDRYALINQVVFDADGRRGLAVGHEGLVLASEDGGRSWRELHFDDGHGEPLMGIARLPGGRLLAVGAFGRMLRSDDDGRRWQRVELPGVEDRHLNRIVGSDDGRHWVIVGERGLVLTSDATGEQWQTQPAFYNGSFYNAAALPGGEWLVYGMRGNAFRSSDDARQWQRAELGVAASFFDHARGADGQLLLVGQGGLVATSTDGGQHFAVRPAGPKATLMAAIAGPERLWLAGEAGVLRQDMLALAAGPSSTSRELR